MWLKAIKRSKNIDGDEVLPGIVPGMETMVVYMGREVGTPV